jgi:CyaY protein
MNESEFNQRVEETLLKIEEDIDASGADIDYENVSGILTLTFEDDSQIIINRQAAMNQLWVAAKSGGYHFDWDEEAGGWVRDSDHAPLFEVLTEVMLDHDPTPFRFSQ